jgi:hypothetical protein
MSKLKSCFGSMLEWITAIFIVFACGWFISYIDDNKDENQSTTPTVQAMPTTSSTNLVLASNTPVTRTTGEISLSDFVLSPVPTTLVPPTVIIQTITNTPPPIPTATITHTPIASFLQNTLSPESQALLTEVASSISSGSQAETLILNSLRGRDDVSVRINEWVPSISTEFRMNASVWGAEQDILKVTCELKESGLIPDFVYIFVAQVELVDRFGNITVESGVTAQLRPETVAKMNCNNRGLIELSSIADSHRIHPALR